MEPDSLPPSGNVAYLGPELTANAIASIEASGWTFTPIDLLSTEATLPANATLLVLGIGMEHPLKALVQAEAVKRSVAVRSDLAFFAHLSAAAPSSEHRHVVISGAAGKTTTAAILMSVLAQGGREATAATAADGYLNALGQRSEVTILTAQTSALRDVTGLPASAGVILNMHSGEGQALGARTKEAAAALLLNASLGVLGADDAGGQGLLMALKRRTGSGEANVIPISGGATLSDGWFAIDRTIYAVRNGRTRRVGSYAGSVALIGDHLGQDAAAASAVASHLGVSDDHISAGLAAFRGVAGRFDCIGAEGRIVFVDDRYAASEASTTAAIAACPEVFWIGARQGRLSNKVRTSLRGSFFLTSPDLGGPPVDDVVTFADVTSATDAALRAARDLVRRDPGATPVLLFSPGARGYGRQGELFRLRALSFMTGRQAAHG